MFYGTLTLTNTFACMQPGIGRIHRAHKTQPEAEWRRCLHQRRGHPRDIVSVFIAWGRVSNKRNVTWAVDRIPSIAATPDAGEELVLEAPRDVDSHVYVRAADASAGAARVSGAADTASANDHTTESGTAAAAAGCDTAAIHTAALTITPGTENPQISDEPPDGRLLQPGRTRSRTRAYNQSTTTARLTDHTLANQRLPIQPNQSIPALPCPHAM